MATLSEQESTLARKRRAPDRRRLKKLFDQTWDQGAKVGHHQAVGQSIRDQLGDFGDLFEK